MSKTPEGSIKMTAVEHPSGTYLLYAHAVADQEDNVLDLSCGNLGDRYGLVRGVNLVLVVFLEFVVRVFGQIAALVYLLREQADCLAQGQ